MNWYPDEEPLVNECEWWRRCAIPQSPEIASVEMGLQAFKRNQFFFKRFGTGDRSAPRVGRSR
jgi:hypothetical protein